MKKIILLLLVTYFLVACTQNNTYHQKTIHLEFTAATTSKLPDLETCGKKEGLLFITEVRQADNLDYSSSVVMRMGSGDFGGSQSYKVGEEVVQVIVSKTNPTSSLKYDILLSIFTGQITNWKNINGKDAAISTWAFSQGDDIAQIFDQLILAGKPKSPSINIAMTPDEMSNAVANDPNAIGYLPRLWKMGNVRDVFTLSPTPIIVAFGSEEKGVANLMVNCLNK